MNNKRSVNLIVANIWAVGAILEPSTKVASGMAIAAVILIAASILQRSQA